MSRQLGNLFPIRKTCNIRHIFFLFGQSNAEGRAPTDEMPDDYRTLPSNVTYYYNGYKQTQVDKSGMFGPEAALIHEASAYFGADQIMIIQRASTGRSLYCSWRKEWDATRAAVTGETYHMYPKATTDRQNICGVECGFEDRIGAICWVQGERDAKLEITADDYLAGLAKFVDDIRGDLCSLPVIVARVNPTGSTYPYISTVRAALTSLPRDDMSWIDCDDLGKIDAAHFDAPGQITLGTRFFETFVEDYIKP